ncbi:MAG: hypothetical protein HFJ32_02070 [Clostridia bacterium]|nr:hypothetical protein [Clostridia bacterium]
MIAEVILNSNSKQLNRVFDYQIPEEIASKVKIGSRIMVPFGNRKEPEEGFVVNFKETSSYQVKAIKQVDETEYISQENIELAKWMARRYFCNISDCIKLMLPPGTTTRVLENRVKEKSASFVYLEKDGEEIELAIENKQLKSDKQIRALRFLLENEEVLVTDLEIFADVSRSVINTLKKNGYIEIIERPIERNPFIHKVIEKDQDLVLTPEQNQAYQTICDSMEDYLYSEFLLFGVTGSRKDRSIFAID